MRDGPVRATPEVEGLLRELVPQVPGMIARRFGDFDAALLQPPPAEAAGQDDTLIVLFLCCHPALTDTSAIALTCASAAA